MKTVLKILAIAWVIFIAGFWIVRMETFYQQGDFAPLVWVTWLTGVWMYILWPWLTALWICAVAYVIGDWLMTLFGIDHIWNIRIDALVFLAVGLGILSLIVFLVGLSGFLYGELMILAGVLVISSGFRLVRGLMRRVRDILDWVTEWEWWEWALLGVIAYYVYKTWALTGCPTVGWDESNSHLAAAKMYVRDHAIIFDPNLNFNNFPAMVEMLVTLQLFATKTPGAVFPYIFHLLTLLGIYHLASIFFNKGPYSRPAGLISCIVYLCIPIMTQYSQAILTDPALTFYCLMTLLLTLFPGTHRQAGIMAGIALGIKYTAFPWVALCGIILLIDKDPFSVERIEATLAKGRELKKRIDEEIEKQNKAST